jgi:hypothetical protein
MGYGSAAIAPAGYRFRNDRASSVHCGNVSQSSYAAGRTITTDRFSSARLVKPPHLRVLVGVDREHREGQRWRSVRLFPFPPQARDRERLHPTPRRYASAPVSPSRSSARRKFSTGDQAELQASSTRR